MAATISKLRPKKKSEDGISKAPNTVLRLPWAVGYRPVSGLPVGGPPYTPLDEVKYRDYLRYVKK